MIFLGMKKGGNLQSTSSSSTHPPTFVKHNLHMTFFFLIHSTVFLHASLAISSHGRNVNPPFFPKQYVSVICISPQLSDHANTTHLSSKLCLYATCKHAPSCNNAGIGSAVNWKLIAFGGGFARIIDGEYLACSNNFLVFSRNEGVEAEFDEETFAIKILDDHDADEEDAENIGTLRFRTSSDEVPDDDDDNSVGMHRLYTSSAYQTYSACEGATSPSVVAIKSIGTIRKTMLLGAAFLSSTIAFM